MPYPYPVCPGNGFVMYQDTFSETELVAIKSIVLTDEYRRLRRENTDYYMIAYVKERTDGHDYDLGNMYLRASWEAERDRPYLVDRYRALAIERFDAFAKREPNRSKEWWTASILAAELDRLLGHFDTVEVRFNGLPLAELSARFADTGLVDVVDQFECTPSGTTQIRKRCDFAQSEGGRSVSKRRPWRNRRFRFCWCSTRPSGP